MFVQFYFYFCSGPFSYIVLTIITVSRYCTDADSDHLLISSIKYLICVHTMIRHKIKIKDR